MPRNSGPFGWDTRGRKIERFSDGKCHRKSNRRHFARDAARVKRCGKSAPREAQATRHGKPHRVQGQIGNPGAARSRFRESETDSGYRLLRQMILSPALLWAADGGSRQAQDGLKILLVRQLKEGLDRQNSAYSPSKTISLIIASVSGRVSFANSNWDICRSDGSAILCFSQVWPVDLNFRFDPPRGRRLHPALNQKMSGWFDWTAKFPSSKRH